MLIPVRLEISASLPALRPASQGMASTTDRNPNPTASVTSARHRVDVAEVELRLDQDRPPAVDDQVFVAIGHAQLGRVDVAEDGPDEGHGPGSGETEVTDQPPSILSSCPVTTRDSSDRK